MNARINYQMKDDRSIMLDMVAKTLLAGLFLLAGFSGGQTAQAGTVRIIGDSLQSTPPGGFSISAHLRSYGWQLTCECKPGEALIGHNWRTDHITEDTVVLALLTNDAGASGILGMRIQWLTMYLYGVRRIVSQLVSEGKRVIFVLPTLTKNHALYRNEELHLFRWFGAMVAGGYGAELIDMQALGVPLAADGLHYDATGTQVYAQHLHQLLLAGEH